jgi:hypothetical protein
MASRLLITHLHWLAADTDRAHHEADERLSTVLGHVGALAPQAGIGARIGIPITVFELERAGQQLIRL